jgi:hypothetical protein
MNETGPRTLPPLTPAAAQMLRRAAQLAEGKAVLLDHVLSAATISDDRPVPPVAARPAEELWAALERARSLATAGGAADEPVTHLHLAWAAREEQALAAGLDLNRLRFARFLAQRLRGPAPQHLKVPADALSRLALDVEEGER